MACIVPREPCTSPSRCPQQPSGQSPRAGPIKSRVQSTPDRSKPHVQPESPLLRHHRPALRQRQLPHRPHHGVHPGRHLGPPAPPAGPRGAFRRRRRRAWRADHDRGREGRHHAATVRRQHRDRPRPVPRRLPRQVRQLELDRQPREPRAGAGDLPRPQGQRPDQHQDDRAVLRPREEHVPARPLHQGRVPEMRRQGPIRRQLRELRRRLCPDRTQEPLLGAVGRHARAAHLGALLLQAQRPALHRVPRELDRRGRPPAARGAQQDQGMVPEG